MTPEEVTTVEIALRTGAPTLSADHGSVVVAADDPDLRRRIARPLLEHGFEVIEGTGAADALPLARRFPVDVAVVDIGRSGVEVADLLRRWQDVERGWYVPVVLVGARGAPDAVVAAINLGAHDELLAPFDDVDVLARVLSALVAKRRHDVARRRMTELQQLVRTDPLTGLYNRRHMEAELAVLASAARRQRTPLGLLLADVESPPTKPAMPSWPTLWGPAASSRCCRSSSAETPSGSWPTPTPRSASPRRPASCGR